MSIYRSYYLIRSEKMEEKMLNFLEKKEDYRLKKLQISWG